MLLDDGLALDESAVPVTSTRCPTNFESSSLFPSSEYVEPELEAPDVPTLLLLELLPLDADAPVERMALVSVNSLALEREADAELPAALLLADDPLPPCRQPTTVIVPLDDDSLELDWPEVPAARSD